jgi:hypothetical protein
MEAWMWLSIGLLLAVYLMSLFYGDCIMRRVDPKMCGALYGTFTVDVGASRSVSNTCNGRCQFSVKNLQEAVEKCNRDSCNEFYYENGQMAYLNQNSPRISNSDGGIYTRIGNIVK